MFILNVENLCGRVIKVIDFDYRPNIINMGLVQVLMLSVYVYQTLVPGLSFEAGCHRNSTSTLYSAAGYFLCIKDYKCVIPYDNNLGLVYKRALLIPNLSIIYFD